ncbi:B-cell receptor CD22 isoform X1 [Carassius gibelio]|uniref:B-cell receptor CD22 isoform X1 n=1 Tax=Carassius gibelio TaxID=101364 RepID=UPI00227768BB|nr:B-cell receptor CD22 isoform X1 [Carassius gibelio]
MSENNCIQYINCHCYMTIQSLQIKARMFSLFSLISLIMIPVIWSQDWQVQYSSMMKCALKGSNTHLSGSYKHPNHLTVIKTFWIVNPVKGEETINLVDHPDYKGRVQYSQNKDGIFFLSLSNVTHKDEGMYCLRIVAKEDKYLFFPGIDLKVTELRVEIPEEALEGKSSILFCKTTCNLSDKTNFTWYKNSKRLSESNVSDQLLLPSVSTDDTGNYSCAVTDQKHLSSPAVTLSVRYPPKSVSVSISPSEIVEGDSVTLICSSDSNPPALNFSWFKENQSSSVGSGQSFIISSFNSSHSGRYYCEAQNKYGSQRSASVSLTSAGDQKAVLYAAAAIGAMLICICIFIVVKKNISRKTGDAGGQSGVSKQAKNNSTAVTDQTSAKPPKPADLNESVYASITHSRPREQQRAGDEDEVQYATVQHHRNTRNTTAEDGCQNGNSVSAGSNTEKADDSNVIYSSIKSS